MKRLKIEKVYMADTETTEVNTTDGIKTREIWNVTSRQVPTRKDESDYMPTIYNNVFDWLEGLIRDNSNMIVYYHNLAYDGSYIVHALKQVGAKDQMDYYDKKKKEVIHGPIMDGVNIEPNHYSYLIDDVGKWYTLKYRTSKGKIIEFRDSLKLFQADVKSLGRALKGFEFKQVDYGKYWNLQDSKNIDVAKGHLDHSKKRSAYGEITPLEAKYSCEDVAIVYYYLKDFLVNDMNGDIQNIPMTVSAKTEEDFYMMGFSTLRIGDKNEKGHVITRKDVVRDGMVNYEKAFPAQTDFPLDLDIDANSWLGIVSKNIAKNNARYDYELFTEYPKVKPYVEANPKIVTDALERKKIEDASILQTLDVLFPLNAFDYCLKAYHGGKCGIVNEKFKDKILTPYPEDFTNAISEVMKVSGGCVCDANSLYPSVMISYPFSMGNPVDVCDGYLPDYLFKPENKGRYAYLVRFKCRVVDIKEGKAPFIQIKGNYLYNGTKYLTTTDYIDELGKRHKEVPFKGSMHECKPILTMYTTSYERFLKDYIYEDLEIIDAIIYEINPKNMFKKYINTLAQLKMKYKEEENWVQYASVKRYMNALYGKFCSTRRSNYKVIKDGQTGEITFEIEYASNKRVGYLPVGLAITDNGREELLKVIENNYENVIYCDTDSVHCACNSDELKGVPLDPVKLNFWDVEKDNLYAMRYVRPKTYIDYMDKENFDIKCAGMPKSCTKVLELLSPQYQGLTEYELKNLVDFQELQPDVQNYVLNKRRENYQFTIDNFTTGLTVAGKLMPKQVRGGIDLVPTTFEMKPQSESAPLARIMQDRAKKQKEKIERKKSARINKKAMRKKQRNAKQTLQ